MNIEESFHKRLQEYLSNIPIENKTATTSFLLMKDYLSRMYKWYSELGIENDFEWSIYRTVDGNNLFQVLNTHIYQKLKPIDQFIKEDLKNTKFKNYNRREFSHLFIYLSIYWDIFKEDPAIKQFDHLPNPYEPALRILYRGDKIGRTEGHFNVGGAYEIRQTKSALTFELPSLSDNFLDFIDSNYPFVDTLNIPNQERVNQLWEEFKG